MARWICALTIVVLAFSPTVFAAEDPVAIMRQAGARYIDGDYTATLEQIRRAYETTWNLAPMSVNNAQFVTEAPEAYGMYTPRPDGPFDAVEPIQLYCEPVGFSIVKDGDWYSAALTADFALADEAGTVLGQQPNFYQWEGRSRNFNSEVMIFFTINLKGLAPGSYKLLVTLNDQKSDKKVTFEKPIVIQ